MTREREAQLLRRNPAAVVRDTDPFDAALFQAHLHGFGTRVHRVFNEFFNDRRRAFNNFARGDLADELIRQCVNMAHFSVFRGHEG